MRKITFDYLEIVNETEQLMIFTVKFDKEEIGLPLILNTALPAPIQDIQIRRTIEKLQKLTRKDVAEMS